MNQIALTLSDGFVVERHRAALMGFIDSQVDILFDGINFVPIAMGVFGLNEIMANLTSEHRRDLLSSKVTGLMPTRADLKASFGAMLRGVGAIQVDREDPGTLVADLAARAAQGDCRSRNRLNQIIAHSTADQAIDSCQGGARGRPAGGNHKQNHHPHQRRVRARYLRHKNPH